MSRKRGRSNPNENVDSRCTKKRKGMWNEVVMKFMRRGGVFTSKSLAELVQEDIRKGLFLTKVDETNFESIRKSVLKSLHILTKNGLIEKDPDDAYEFSIVSEPDEESDEDEDDDREEVGNEHDDDDTTTATGVMLGILDDYISPLTTRDVVDDMIEKVKKGEIEFDKSYNLDTNNDVRLRRGLTKLVSSILGGQAAAGKIDKIDIREEDGHGRSQVAFSLKKDTNYTQRKKKKPPGRMENNFIYKEEDDEDDCVITKIVVPNRINRVEDVEDNYLEVPPPPPPRQTKEPIFKVNPIPQVNHRPEMMQVKLTPPPPPPPPQQQREQKQQEEEGRTRSRELVDNLIRVGKVSDEDREKFIKQVKMCIIEFRSIIPRQVNPQGSNILIMNVRDLIIQIGSENNVSLEDQEKFINKMLGIVSEFDKTF